MDTATIIVALFIISILSASLSSKQAPTPSPGARIAAPITVNALNEADRTVAFSIKQFIVSYKAGDETAETIALRVVQYGREVGVDPKLVAALMAVESGFNPRDVSSSGAKGLGQLMPGTAAGLGVTDPFDIDQNVRGTTQYIKMMFDRWAGNPNQVGLALASYKDGYGAVSRANGNLSEDTRRYIARIVQLKGSM